MKSPTPKGKNKRCLKHLYVGNIPTVPGEVVWRCSDGVVEKVKSKKQVDGEELLIVTRGNVPSADQFSSTHPSPGSLGPDGWAAVTSSSSLDRQSQKAHRDSLPDTLASYPFLASRVASSVSDIRPAFDPLGNSPDARLAVSFSAEVQAAGGRVLLVGGAVRDQLAGGHASKDLDLEVFNLEPDRLKSLLSRFGKVDTTGARFSVLKLHGSEIDVSLPRRERKEGTGHKGFIVDADPYMSVNEAFLRRDFTINALGFDPLTSRLVDTVGGVKDLKDRVLRHVSSQFGEDPMRVLRGAQFVSRFDLTADSSTVSLCASLRPEAETLAQQPIFDEWKKLLCRGSKPGRGLQFLEDVQWVDVWPEVANLRTVAQDPTWHPEGDVFVHTTHALDALGSIRSPDQDETDRLVVALAVLCHDLGKPETTVFMEGRWRALGHEQAGVAPTRRLLSQLCNLTAIPDRVAPLVEHHLAPVSLFNDQAGDAAVRRLAKKVGRLDLLVEVAHADQAGRPPLTVDRFEAGEWLLAKAESLGVKDAAPKPLVNGKALIDLGVKPSKVFKQVLDEVYAAQLDGVVSTPVQAREMVELIVKERSLAS